MMDVLSGVAGGADELDRWGYRHVGRVKGARMKNGPRAAQPQDIQKSH